MHVARRPRPRGIALIIALDVVAYGFADVVGCRPISRFFASRLALLERTDASRKGPVM